MLLLALLMTNVVVVFSLSEDRPAPVETMFEVDPNQAVIGAPWSDWQASNLEVVSFDQNVGVNMCFDEGLRVVRYIKKGDTKVYGSAGLVKCDKFFNRGDGVCNKSEDTCYHKPGCQYPKVYKLPAGNCKSKDWEMNKPKYCSVMTTREGCELSGHVVRLPWIIDAAGEKRFVDQLRVEYAQQGTKEESYWEEKRYETSGIVSGDREYCEMHNQHNCIVREEDGKRPFRVAKREKTIPIAHIGSCETPVYCYGFEDVLVFGWASNKTIKDCYTCHLTCDPKVIRMVVPDTTTKHIRICGRQFCTLSKSNEKIISIPRTFHQMITDERITADVVDPQKTFNYHLSSDCPLVEICDAIDCHFCVLRYANPTCYEWFHWVIFLTALYFILCAIGMFLIAIKPIFKLIGGMLKMVSKLCWKITKLCCGKTKAGYVAVNKFAEDEEAPPANDVYKPTSVPARGNYKKPAFNLLVIMICCLASRVESKAPCSAVVIDSIPTEVCTRSGDQYTCQMASLVEVPMISYDQTSCLHLISSKGSILGELQITPMDLGFKCDKRTMFYTRDVVMTVDHMMRCPHAGQCSDSWCEKVDTSTDIKGLPEHPGLKEVMCKLGAACAGNGCFYCTNSCHVVRYYPKPRTSALYEIFECPKWEPSGVFHFEWQGGNKAFTTTVSLLHGQTIALSSEIKVTLQMTVQSKLPVLNKQFLLKANEEDLAIIDSAPANQPQPGMIGQVQCPNKVSAIDLNSECIMAPNLCVCRPTGNSDSCDCSQVSLANVFTSESALPLEIGSDYLTNNRGSPVLKSAAYGSAIIRVHATGKLIGDFVEPETCTVTFSKLKGCHSCIVGANLTYTCDTTKPTSAVAQCDGGLNMVLECDDQGLSRSLKVHIPSPIVDIQCKLECSNKLMRLSGILNSVGLQPLNNGSHIQLSPAPSTSNIFSWLKSIWKFFSWWYISVILAVITVIIIIVILSLVNRSRVIKFKNS